MEKRLVTDGPVGKRLTLSQWIIGFICIELAWTFLGGGATYLFFEATRNHQWSTVVWVDYVGQHVNFIILFIAVLLLVHHGVGTTLRQFITDAPVFRKRLFGFSSLVWFVGIGIGTILTILAEPGAIMYRTTEDLYLRFLMIPIILLLTPLQCIAEELLFRTTLWRILEDRTKRYWVLPVISGLVFTLAHLANLEVRTTSNPIPVLLYYFLTGALFMEMTRVYGGSEAAFGAHVANNLYLALLVNYCGSSLASDSWFLQQKPIIWVDLAILVVCSSIIIRYGNKSNL